MKRVIGSFLAILFQIAAKSLCRLFWFLREIVLSKEGLGSTRVLERQSLPIFTWRNKSLI